ncbi:MAG: PHB depolymerase family esterase [Labilithrix sp.]|nr:PHB depolymerase family esterase [Labilithrix sp.]
MRLAVSIAAAMLFSAATARAGEVKNETHAGRAVRVFVPSKVATPALVVMLHGCTQTPEGFADATQMDVVAEESGFVVAYPEQPSSVGTGNCWRWWDPAHQTRDGGEPRSIADAAEAVARAHGVDPERVYVAGISAGGAMSVILGATHPDRFTAIGVIAGLEYKAATAFSEVLGASGGGGPDPSTQGDLAYAQMGSRARALPVLVIHGTADGVVAKINGDQVAAQWLRTNTRVLGDGAIEAVTDRGEAGYAFVRELHRSKESGASIVEHVVVEGLGHAWPGGKQGGSYSDPKGPDASRMLWSFFRERTSSAPLAAPSSPAPAPPTGAGGGGDADTGGAEASSPASTSNGCAISASGRARDAIAWLAIAVALGCARRARRARRAHSSVSNFPAPR